jgi:hypothetical protein
MGFVFSSPLTAAAIDDQVFTGSGTQAVGPFSMAAGLAVFDWTGTSSSNFIVWLKDSSANDVALIANIIGSGSGSRPVACPATGSYYLQVDSTGPWSITMRQPRPTSAPPGSAYAGSGDAATELFYLTPGAHTFTWSHTGSSNFIVWLLDANGQWVDLLANEIGSSSGSKIVGVAGGLYLLDVSADGAWQVSTPVITLPSASVSRPTGPRTVRRSRRFTVSGKLSPRHKARSYAVTIQAERFDGVGWVLQRTFRARVANSGRSSRYSGSVKLPSRGQWRIRATHSDGGHAASFSSYRSIRVK